MEKRKEKPVIFIFTTAYEPFIGGAEIAVKEITKRLKDEFRFFIFTSRFRPDLPKREEKDGIVIRRIGFGVSFDKFFVPLLGFFLVRRYAAKYKPAVFWAIMASYASGIPYLINMMRIRRHIPIILTLQEGDPIEHVQKAKLGLIRFSWQAALKRTDYLTAISTFLLNAAIDFGYQREASVIPNGVDIPAFTKDFMPDELKVLRGGLGIGSDEKVVITTSRLVEKNAVDVAIRATGVLKRKGVKAKFIIIGSGENEKKLGELARQEGVDDRVIFLGSVPHSEIPKYLKISDVFIRPSRSEGLGNSFIEAMAAGLPIIGTTVGGIADFLENGKTGLTVRVDDPEDLAEKIELVLFDGILAARLGGEGVKVARMRFGWDVITESFRRVFIHRVGWAEKMAVLIATPLFPPQIGGPALYAENLGCEFETLGHSCRILSFGSFLRYPLFIRHLFYAARLFRFASGIDIIFSLDHFSVGAPAALVSFITRKPLILRLEGDFLWESFVERTRADITLSEFYQHVPPLSFKEYLKKCVSGIVIRMAARVVFSSQWRSEMLQRVFRVFRSKSAIVKNVLPRPAEEKYARQNVILWAGRMLYIKNLYRLIRAFAKANDGNWELHLVGDGPEERRLKKFAETYPHIRFFPACGRKELLRLISSVSVIALPSLSEVWPNIIAEAVAAKTPCIMTKESGSAEELRGACFLVDPRNEDTLFEATAAYMDGVKRKEAERRIERFSFTRDWEEAARDWLSVFRSALEEAHSD